MKGWHKIEAQLDVDEMVDDGLKDVLAGFKRRLQAEVLMDAIDKAVGR